MHENIPTKDKCSKERKTNLFEARESYILQRNQRLSLLLSYRISKQRKATSSSASKLVCLFHSSNPIHSHIFSFHWKKENNQQFRMKNIRQILNSRIKEKQRYCFYPTFSFLFKKLCYSFILIFFQSHVRGKWDGK